MFWPLNKFIIALFRNQEYSFEIFICNSCKIEECKCHKNDMGFIHAAAKTGLSIKTNCKLQFTFNHLSPFLSVTKITASKLIENYFSMPGHISQRWDHSIILYWTLLIGCQSVLSPIYNVFHILFIWWGRVTLSRPFLRLNFCQKPFLDVRLASFFPLPVPLIMSATRKAFRDGFGFNTLVPVAYRVPVNVTVSPASPELGFLSRLFQTLEPVTSRLVRHFLLSLFCDCFFFFGHAFNPFLPRRTVPNGINLGPFGSCSNKVWKAAE